MKVVDYLNLLELAKKPFPSPSKPPSRPPPKSQFKKWLWGFFWRLLLYCLIILGFFFVYQKIYVDRIYPGVYLGKFQIGSLKYNEIKILLESVIEEIETQGLEFVGQSELGKKEVSIKPILIAVTDPDLSRRIINFDLEATLAQAMAVGRSGSVVEKIKQILFSQLHGWQIKAVVQIDKNELKENIRAHFQSHEQKPKDASFELTKTGEIKIIADQAGYFFNFDQAVSETEQNLLNLVSKPVVLQLIHQEPQIKTEDLELMLGRIKEILDLAPLILRFKEKEWTVKKDLFSQWLSLRKKEETELVINQESVSAYLNFLSKEINKEALDAKFKMSDGRVVEFQPSRSGLKLQIEASAQEISRQVLAGNREINLIVEAVEPEVLTQDVNDLGIKELIGRGVSSFKGSPKNRRHNIALGAKKLNGILIKPDEEFSLLKAIGKVGEEDGYLPELVIKGKRTIPELGGGLCQIGTTTFRVALDAGLPITQRTPHAFRVIYYEPAGTDATIYQPQPDFRFINDTGHYILFQTKIEGDDLIFEFYGTSDGRKVEVSQPKIFNVVQPGPPVYIETTELPAGEKKRVERAVAGADTEFTRIITWPDGRKKEEIWKSHYQPWREVWLVGVEKKEELR
ncbi:MAG: VanW family protein [Patescibacteria group bacterium]